MIFDPILSEGRLIKRYKRFFADVETPKGILTLHVPNTGSLKGCLDPQNPVLYSISTDPKRKLKGTLQFIQTKTSWVGVNTSLPNALVEELWKERPLKHWSKFKAARREVKINPKSRIDLMLAQSEKDLEERQHCHFIEVKNVTMAQTTSSETQALFPDAVTERGQKHLIELMNLIDEGHTAEIFFVIQRTDCTEFAPCREIDPKYADLLKQAQEAGVKISAHSCVIDKKKGITIGDIPLKIKL